MSIRSRKLLSLLLAVAMVFSMNTFAFGGETKSEVEVPAFLTTSESNSISSDVMKWYIKDDRALMREYFVGWEEAGESEKKTVESDHLVNGKPIKISDNQGGNKWEAGKFYYPIGVSSNVFKLNDTTYLIVTYSAGGIQTNKNGTNVPLVYFNGKKFVPSYKDPNNGKVDKENYVLWANAALVKQEAGKAPELIANTGSMNKAKKPKSLIQLTINPKNNQYANVSRNDTGKGHDAIENPYLKSGTYPYFTISVKLDKELKEYKKDLNKAVGQDGKELKKSEFKFDIARNIFADASFTTVSEGNFVGEAHYGSKYWNAWTEKFGFRHAFPDIDLEYNGDGEAAAAAGGSWIGERTLSLDWGENKESTIMGTLDLFTDAKKVGKNNISVFLVNGAGENAGNITATGWNKKGSFTNYKLKAKKDYEVDTSLGSGILLLKPIGNFEGDGAIFRNVEYTVPAGYYDLQAGKSIDKEKKITELRVGVYNMTTQNYYVDSVD